MEFEGRQYFYTSYLFVDLFLNIDAYYDCIAGNVGYGMVYGTEWYGVW